MGNQTSSKIESTITEIQEKLPTIFQQIGRPSSLSTSNSDGVYVLQFRQACEEGSLLKAKQLLSQHPQLLNMELGDSNATIIATDRNHLPLLEYFLSFPSYNVNLPDSSMNKWNALHYSTWKNRTECVRLLIQHPMIDVNFPVNYSWCTALHIAAKNDHRECLRLLLQHPKLDVNLKDSHGCTALHEASFHGFAECVNLLLIHPNINVDLRNDKNLDVMDICCKASNAHHSQKEFIRSAIQTFKLEQQRLKELPVPTVAIPSLITTPTVAVSSPTLAASAITPLVIDAHTSGRVRKPLPPIPVTATSSTHSVPVDPHTPVTSQSVDSPQPGSATRVTSLSTTSITASESDHPISLVDGKYDVFLTHDWGVDEQTRSNHIRVSKINSYLKQHGINTWFDQDRLEGNIRSQMAQAIANSKIVLVFITERYKEKIDSNRSLDNCYFEFNYATSSKDCEWLIPVVMEERMRSSSTWGIRLAAELSTLLYVDLVEDETTIFERQCGELMKLIRMKLTKYSELHSPK